MSLHSDNRMDIHDALQMNALQLAYLGDTVWEMLVRYDLVIRGYTVHHMHKDCVSQVNAHSQSLFLQILQPYLSETESELVRRGRNAHAKHSAPKNQNPDDYAASTGFEALFGFLYITGQEERISILVNLIKEVNNHV